MACITNPWNCATTHSPCSGAGGATLSELQAEEEDPAGEATADSEIVTGESTTDRPARPPSNASAGASRKSENGESTRDSPEATVDSGSAQGSPSNLLLPAPEPDRGRESLNGWQPGRGASGVGLQKADGEFFSPSNGGFSTTLRMLAGTGSTASLKGGACCVHVSIHCQSSITEAEIFLAVVLPIACRDPPLDENLLEIFISKPYKQPQPG